MFALDILNQYQSENGNVLAAGKLFIYKQGRTELAEIYSDINGSVELANPVILNNLGMTDTPVYLSRLYSYTVVCKNMYGEELFSRDVYPNIDSDAGPAISGYLYEGISPIVVNNVDKAISAINVPIGVQEPLYFVEDSSAACIIGIDSTGMLSGYVTSGDLATVSGEITAMIPTALTGEYLDKASADTLYYPLNTNPSGYLVEDDITGKQDVSAMTAYVQNSALTAQLTLSGGSGVSLVEDYINDVLWINVTAEGGDTAVNSLVHANSADWNEVSAKQPSGDYYSASNPSGFITGVDLTPYQEKTAMSGYLTTGDSAQFYTNDNPSGFITGVDLSDYATKDFVNDNINSSNSGLLPTSSFSSVSGSFLTALPSDLVYTADITGKLDTSAFSSISGDYLVGSNVSGFVITATGDGFYNGMTVAISQDQAFAGMYLSESDINGSKQIYIDPDKIMFYSAGTPDPSAESIDAGDIATLKTLSSSKQDSLTFAYTTANEISAINSSAIACGYDSAVNLLVHTNSGTWNSVTGKLDESVYATQSGNFLTAVPDTYLQNTDLGISDNKITGISGVPLSAGSEFPASADEACALVTANSGTWDSVTGKQDITGMTAYMTTADSANFYTTANESGFITGVDLTPYQTVEGMTAYQEAGDYYSASNPSGFLTAHQSLEGYLQDSDLGISDNKVTAISGVELSAGGDVPEGVMVESGIEYNSQGYINGYSGSAIATIDQERQWFTHDDTLCHISNSAQYALGVNMSAISADLARMMGVDETVLWSGDATTATQTLSENITAFDEIKVYGKSHNNYPWISNCWITGDVIYGVGAQMWWNNPGEFDVSRFCLSGSKIVPGKGSWYSFPAGGTTGTVTGNNAQNSFICKVVGIHRINGGN